MIIVMRRGATGDEIEHVVERIERAGLRAHVSQGEERTVIGVIGDERTVAASAWTAMPGVDHVMPVLRPYKLASREMQPEDSVLEVGGVKIGGGTLVIMAGPCTVEDRQMLLEAAAAVKQHGAHLLRGGAFKPRTSPYDFQGLGVEGLRLLQEAGKTYGLPVVTEVRTPAHVEPTCLYADMLQIGARNMQNFDLLKEVGQAGKPVLLKRGISASLREFLMAAEYILAEGNRQVALCERGIRTFENATRFTLDVSAVPVIKENSHLPVIIDPSHAAGKASLVPALARAGVAAGADGILVEVHCHPEDALCDGPQMLTPDVFGRLVGELSAIHQCLQATKEKAEERI